MREGASSIRKGRVKALPEEGMEQHRRSAAVAVSCILRVRAGEHTVLK